MTSRNNQPVNRPKVSKRGGASGRGKAYRPPLWAEERRRHAEAAARFVAKDQAEQEAAVAAAVERANRLLAERMDEAEVTALGARL